MHSTELKLAALHWNQLLFAEVHCTLCMYLRHKFSDAPFLCISVFCKLDLTLHLKPRLQLLPLLTRVLAFQRWDMLLGKFSTTTTSEWNEQQFNLPFPGMCQILLRGKSNQHCLSRNKDHLVWQLPPAATTCFNCWCFKAKSRVCTDSSPISLWSQWTLFSVHSTVCRLYSVHTGLTSCRMYWIVNSVCKIGIVWLIVCNVQK